MPKTLFGKLLLLIAALLFGSLQYSLWFGEGGVQNVNTLKKAIAEQQAENAKLAERNRVLEAEVQDLKTGLEAVEEHSRMDLGMIKQGETFYLVTGSPDGRKPGEAPSVAPPSVSAPPKAAP
jgi:cell division protein FtsB